MVIYHIYYIYIIFDVNGLALLLCSLLYEFNGDDNEWLHEINVDCGSLDCGMERTVEAGVSTVRFLLCSDFPRSVQIFAFMFGFLEIQSRK